MLKNKKYAILIGRRQPAHLGHLDCILDVVKKGLIPVIFLGSSNDVYNKNYNPFENPLTVRQSEEQMEFILKNAKIEQCKIMPLPDFGDAKLWTKEVIRLIGVNFPDQELSQFLFHFFVKNNKENNLKNQINPLDSYVANFQEYGIEPMIFVGSDKNSDLHSADFRKQNVNLDSFGKVGGGVKILYSDQIIDLANQAREENSKNGFEEVLKNVEITMLDLTLNRLIKELKITPEMITKSEKDFDFDKLFDAISVFFG